MQNKPTTITFSYQFHSNKVLPISTCSFIFINKMLTFQRPQQVGFTFKVQKVHVYSLREFLAGYVRRSHPIELQIKYWSIILIWVNLKICLKWWLIIIRSEFAIQFIDFYYAYWYFNMLLVLSAIWETTVIFWGSLFCKIKLMELGLLNDWLKMRLVKFEMF